MDRLHIFIIVLSGISFGVVSFSHDWISASVLEMTVRPGDNITIYCDCKTSIGVYIVWYRNCSHVNQPSLIMGTRYPHEELLENSYSEDILNPFPRFHLVKNQSSESYDLLIMNITDSDGGLYYCGTEKHTLEEKGYITPRYVYKYGHDTIRILVNTNEPYHHGTPQDCGVCWMLLFSLCPAFAVLSSLLSSLLVYHLCRKTAEELQVGEMPEIRSQTRGNQDEDVCYAALEIHQASQRPKKKKKQNSDFCTYSAVNTCRV